MLALNDVSFSYDDKWILRNVSVRFPETGLVVLLGSSGCGKTTFLSLCSGILQPTVGEIDRNSIEKPAQVFQSPLLLDYLNVLENVLLPLRLSGRSNDVSQKEALRALTQVGLQGKERQSVVRLSGGEKMRVSIARALVSRSGILILDEPTGQLDERNSREIYSLLKKLSRERLVLLVTHDERNALEMADFLYRLDEGRLLLLRGRDSPSSKANREAVKTSRNGRLSLVSSFHLVFAFLRKRRIRFLFSSFFLALMLSFLNLGIDFSWNAEASFSALFREYYDSTTMSLSQKETIASSGPLSLERFMVPDADTCMQLGTGETFPSFSFFLPESAEVSLNDAKASIEILPVLQQEESRLLLGRMAMDYQEVVVNASFLDAFSLSGTEALGKAFVLRHSLIAKSVSLLESDVLQLDYRFKIVGVSREKKAFNTPTCYYDYFSLSNRFDSIYLENISLEMKEPISILGLFHKTQEREDDFRGAKVLFLSRDPHEAVERGKRLFGERIRLYSKSDSIRQSTSEMASALMEVLLAFLVLSLITAFMLAYLSVYSLYAENLRLFALVRVFPQSKANRRRISYGMLLAFFLSTMLFVLLLSISASLILNGLLSFAGFPTFLSIINPLSLAASLLMAFLFSFLASVLPLRKVSGQEVKKELEGDD